MEVYSAMSAHEKIIMTTNDYQKKLLPTHWSRVPYQIKAAWDNRDTAYPRLAKHQVWQVLRAVPDNGNMLGWHIVLG